MESDPQLKDSFMTMRAMVEEMYRELKKGREEDLSKSKQDKGAKESFLHDHSKGKGKEEKLPTPPSSPENKKKTSLIKLDVKFDLPIHDGDLNEEKLIIGSNRLMFIAKCRASIRTVARFSSPAYVLEALPLYGGKAGHKLT